MPGPHDETHSLWVRPRQGDRPQARVPTNKLRSYLYTKAARTNATVSSRARPDLVPWQNLDATKVPEAPQSLHRTLKGKSHQDLRRPYLLA